MCSSKCLKCLSGLNDPVPVVLVSWNDVNVHRDDLEWTFTWHVWRTEKVKVCSGFARVVLKLGPDIKRAFTVPLVLWFTLGPNSLIVMSVGVSYVLNKCLAVEI